MAGGVRTASVQIPSDVEAPMRFDLELDAVRMAFVEPPREREP